MSNVGIVEVLTGRMRPRHVRFSRALSTLMHDIARELHVTEPGLTGRLQMQARTHLRGYRNVSVSAPDSVAVVHQALNLGHTPYVSEFDVPMGVHGYKIGRHRRYWAEAGEVMKRPTCRAVLTFSDWAARSFALHYGPEIGGKCRTVYPLAYELAATEYQSNRTFDFAFISTNFRIKGGPEVVRAFAEARALVRSDARMCVVTSLEQASLILGRLEDFEGVEWREATLSEREIAQLLADTRCLLHPSMSDSFGVVVLEALAAGCAIVASDIASFPEMVRTANGWLISVPTAAVVGDTYLTEFGNTSYHEDYLRTLSLHQLQAALVEPMRTILAEPDRTSEMMTASRQLFVAKFSFDAWQKRMTGVLAEAFPELGVPAHGA